MKDGQRWDTAEWRREKLISDDGFAFPRNHPLCALSYSLGEQYCHNKQRFCCFVVPPLCGPSQACRTGLRSAALLRLAAALLSRI